MDKTVTLKHVELFTGKPYQQLVCTKKLVFLIKRATENRVFVKREQGVMRVVKGWVMEESFIDYCALSQHGAELPLSFIITAAATVLVSVAGE